VQISIKGDEALVKSAEVVATEDGWELKVSRVKDSSAYLSGGSGLQQVPVQVVFDIIPDDWEINRRTSRECAAAVIFTATTVDEARALRNLTRAQWRDAGTTVTRLALRRGRSPTEFVARLLRLRRG